MLLLYDNGLTWAFWALCALWWTLFLFFSIVEVAYSAFSPFRLGDSRRWRGREELLEGYLEKAERMRLTCVAGGIASTVAFSVVATFGATEMVEALTNKTAGLPALAVTFAVILVQLMVARVFGRAVGTRFAEGIVSRTITTLYPVSFVFEPLLRLRGAFDRLLVAKDRSASIEFADEIRSVVEDGEDEAPLEQRERDMIQSIIEFRNVEVREIMTPRTEVDGIEVGTSLEDAQRIAIEQGHTRLPVYRETLDNIVGVLNIKDLIRRIGRPGWEAAGLEDVMRKPRFIPETKKIDELFQELRVQKTHMAIVVDEYGGTAGVVTIEDIIEEIVGEIHDEYDIETSEPIEHIDETTIEVDGKVRVSDLNDIFPLDIAEDGDFDTVGGFVFSHLGRIPRVGERFEYGNAEITVLDADERRINRLRFKSREHAPGAENS